MDEKKSYDGAIYVADALNLRRSLLLFKQVKDLGVPMVMLVNQIDLAKKRAEWLQKVRRLYDASG